MRCESFILFFASTTSTQKQTKNYNICKNKSVGIHSTVYNQKFDIMCFVYTCLCQFCIISWWWWQGSLTLNEWMLNCYNKRMFAYYRFLLHRETQSRKNSNVCNWNWVFKTVRKGSGEEEYLMEFSGGILLLLGYVYEMNDREINFSFIKYFVLEISYKQRHKHQPKCFYSGHI